MEFYKEILVDFILPLLGTVTLGLLGYLIKQVDRIKSSISSLNQWRASVDATGKYERRDIDGVSNKLEGLFGKMEGVSVLVYEMKATMVKTWDKILDIEKEFKSELQRVDARINELRQEVYRGKN